MARIRQLVNHDTYLSLKIAIQAENIAYSRVVNQFLELWGRMSVRYWGDAWDRSMAYMTINGVETYGDTFVPLFFDSSVDYIYTQRMCKLLGLDYDELNSQRGEVDYFYIDLKGISIDNQVAFRDATYVRTAFGKIADVLREKEVDKLQISFIADEEVSPAVHANMSFEEVRGLTLGIEWEKFTYVFNTTPIVSYFTLPTYTETTVQSEPDAEGNTTTTTVYEEVAGAAVTLGDKKIDNILSLFAINTDMLDLVLGIPTFEIREIESRSGYDEYGYEFSFRRYEVVLTYAFGSYWDFSDEQNIVLVDRIAWDALEGSAFANEFATRTAGFERYYVPPDYNYQIGGAWYPNTPKEAYVFALVITNLATFSPTNDFFYVYTYDPSGGDGVAEFVFAAFRRDKIGSVTNREFADIIIQSLNLTYKKKKKGWFGGNLLGRLLEVAFVLVVTVVGIYFGPIGMMIATIVLALAVKYTGMSASGVGFAMFGMKVLAVAGVLNGLDAIYTTALEDATTVAIAENLSSSAIDAGVGASGAAVANVGAGSVLMQLGLMEVVQIIAYANSFINIVLPPQSSDAPVPTQEEQAQNNGIYSVDASYDLYDNYLSVYEYE